MMERQLATGAGRVRLVGEVDFGQEPATWSEWIRYEAVCNVALAPYPFWSVCAYDTSTLPEPILSAGHRTHPHLLTPAGRRRNHRYVQPARFLRRSQTAEPDPLEATDPTMVAEELTDTARLATLRRRLHDELVRAMVPDPSRADFISAVSEVAANGILHGRPPVQVRVWASLGQLVATVTDQGEGMDDPLAGYLPQRARPARCRHGPVAHPAAVPPGRHVEDSGGVHRPADHHHPRPRRQQAGAWGTRAGSCRDGQGACRQGPSARHGAAAPARPARRHLTGQLSSDYDRACRRPKRK
jgi:hypothetical protein